jgi:hypothetical protein
MQLEAAAEEAQSQAATDAAEAAASAEAAGAGGGDTGAAERLAAASLEVRPNVSVILLGMPNMWQPPQAMWFLDLAASALCCVFAWVASQWRRCMPAQAHNMHEPVKCAKHSAAAGRPTMV